MNKDNRPPIQPKPVQYTKPVHKTPDDGYLKAFNYAENGEFNELKNFLLINPLNLGVLYDGKSILNIITRNDGSVDFIKLLIDRYKASPHLRDDKQRTIMHEAVESENLDVLKYALDEQKMDVNAKDNRGRTPLHYALIAKNVGCDVNHIRNYKNEFFVWDINKQCYTINIDIIEYIFEHSPAYETLDEHNFSPIDYVLNFNNKKLLDRLNEIEKFKTALEMRKQTGKLKYDVQDDNSILDDLEKDSLLRKHIGNILLPKYNIYVNNGKLNIEFFKTLEKIAVRTIEKEDEAYAHTDIVFTDNMKQNIIKLIELANNITDSDNKQRILIYYIKIYIGFVSLGLDKDNRLTEFIFNEYDELNVDFFIEINKKIDPNHIQVYSNDMNNFINNINTLKLISTYPQVDNELDDLKDVIDKVISNP